MHCPCGKTVTSKANTPNGRQRFCSNACKLRAFRRGKPQEKAKRKVV